MERERRERDGGEDGKRGERVEWARKERGRVGMAEDGEDGTRKRLLARRRALWITILEWSNGIKGSRGSSSAIDERGHEVGGCTSVSPKRVGKGEGEVVGASLMGDGSTRGGGHEGHETQENALFARERKRPIDKD